MKQQRRILQRLVLGADLPTETIPGLPLVEIVGQSRVLVENHCGVTAYGCNEVCIKVQSGLICICGSGLELVQMTNCQLIITGRIECVKLNKECR
jgi:sporulation protein YqfC